MEAKVLEVMENAQPLDFEKCAEIADQFGLKTRAVVTSAIRRGLDYNKKVRTNKQGVPTVSKEDLVARVAKAVGVESLAGLEGATKVALQKLHDAVIQ